MSKQSDSTTIVARRKPGLKNDDAEARRYGSERDVSIMTGFSARTLQKDRLLSHNRFPWYKVGGKVLYDLTEIERVIAASRQGAGGNDRV